MREGKSEVGGKGGLLQRSSDEESREEDVDVRLKGGKKK